MKKVEFETILITTKINMLIVQNLKNLILNSFQRSKKKLVFANYCDK